MKGFQKFGYIDALRGYAVLLVIVGHVSQLFTFSGMWPLLLSKTAMGVQLFYVVSALTLTMSWKSRHDGAVNFFIRRLFRIGPLFWLAIIFYLGLYGFGKRSAVPLDISWGDVALTATFTHMVRPSSINSVVPGGWSVAVEMAFYLIFPICMMFIRGWKSAFIFVFLSYYVGKYTSLALAKFYNNGEYSFEILEAWKFYILPSQISAFAIGILLYFVIQMATGLKGRVFDYFAFFVAIFSTVSAFYLLQYGGPIAVLTYSFIFALFALSFSDGNLSLITNRYVQKLGILSFSAYLSHFAVIYALKAFGVVEFFMGYGKSIAFPSLILLVVLITVVVSYFTHRFVEKPGIRLGNMLGGRFQERARSRQPLGVDAAS